MVRRDAARKAGIASETALIKHTLDFRRAWLIGRLCNLGGEGFRVLEYRQDIFVACDNPIAKLWVIEHRLLCARLCVKRERVVDVKGIEAFRQKCMSTPGGWLGLR